METIILFIILIILAGFYDKKIKKLMEEVTPEKMIANTRIRQRELEKKIQFEERKILLGERYGMGKEYDDFINPKALQDKIIKEQDKFQIKIDESKWSEELLQAIEWERFESLCVLYFKVAGHDVKRTTFGADGGIDAVLYRNKKAFAFVQCKARHKGNVGVKIVRELLGVMLTKGIKVGILMTNAGFTDDALALAEEIKTKKRATFNMVDNKKFLGLIQKLTKDKQAELLSMATMGDYQTPTCPRCQRKMVRRERKRDKHPFWGCPSFPKCRAVLNISS